jgi:hypothetical protein
LSDEIDAMLGQLEHHIESLGLPEPEPAPRISDDYIKDLIKVAQRSYVDPHDFGALLPLYDRGRFEERNRRYYAADHSRPNLPGVKDRGDWFEVNHP